MKVEGQRQNVCQKNGHQVNIQQQLFTADNIAVKQ